MYPSPTRARYDPATIVNRESTVESDAAQSQGELPVAGGHIDRTGGGDVDGGGWRCGQEPQPGPGPREARFLFDLISICIEIPVPRSYTKLILKSGGCVTR